MDTHGFAWVRRDLPVGSLLQPPPPPPAKGGYARVPAGTDGYQQYTPPPPAKGSHGYARIPADTQGCDRTFAFCHSMIIFTMVFLCECCEYPRPLSLHSSFSLGGLCSISSSVVYVPWIPPSPPPPSPPPSSPPPVSAGGGSPWSAASLSR